jgi:NAD-dependent deacetylase
MSPSSISIDADTRVLVLTGAGASAESGIPTFRGVDGLWRNHPIEDVASPRGFTANPALVWEFYSERRAGAGPVKPNAGHVALAQLEQRLGDRLLLATQNVDGLHQAAGSQRVIEMHGSLWLTRCSRCDRAPFRDTTAHASPPVCEACGGLLRPDIVWFGENLDPRTFDRLSTFIADAVSHRFVFLAVGTSGLVFPAAQLVHQTRELGAETWLVNADPAANDAAFHHVVHGRSGALLPRLLGGA